MRRTRRVSADIRVAGAGGAPRGSVSCHLTQRLRAERIARGCTQKHLAKRAGIERADLARLETGAHSPSLDTVESLAEAMGLSLVELFDSSCAAAEMQALADRSIKLGVASVVSSK